jgi:hypothetical protein
MFIDVRHDRGLVELLSHNKEGTIFSSIQFGLIQAK